MKFAPRTRGEARLAIEAAMASPYILATADRIAALADALASFKKRDYGAAIALAAAALKNDSGAACGIETPASAPDERRERHPFALGAPCPADVPGCEIYATARLLILQHGPWAGTNAAGRTDAFFAVGDRQSAAVWLRIFNAIGVLGEGKRCEAGDRA